ncbi:putative CRISPR-associated protein [Candidatus Chlorohelix sp.]|uniref:putative CRISPR-associated protein n=1 Tax=Candidatus Chlorohelix sp. TaxID=3139201 RepID=UPI00303A9934
MRTFICTVGTSLVENDGVDSGYVQDLDNASVDANPPAANKVKESIRKAIKNADTRDKKLALSAEIKSLLSAEIAASDEVVLLHSDNKLGQVCAEMLKEILELDKWVGCSVDVRRISDLQVQNFERMNKKGIRNLYEVVIGLIKAKGGEYNKNIILNITGGYKVVVPYLTILGMLYNFKIIYIFENSNELITLPALPIKYDEELLLSAEEFLKKLFADGLLPADTFPKYLEQRRDEYIPAIIIESDGELMLSAFGELLYQRFVQDYPEDLPKCKEKPEEKRLAFKDGEDKPPIVALARRLILSPFVCEIVNSIPFHPGEINRIRPNQNFENGLVEIVLPKTDKGLGMVIRTTGRNPAETKQIADLLAKQYKW